MILPDKQIGCWLVGWKVACLSGNGGGLEPQLLHETEGEHGGRKEPLDPIRRFGREAYFRPYFLTLLRRPRSHVDFVFLGQDYRCNPIGELNIIISILKNKAK